MLGREDDVELAVVCALDIRRKRDVSGDGDTGGLIGIGVGARGGHEKNRTSARHHARYSHELVFGQTIAGCFGSAVQEGGRKDR